MAQPPKAPDLETYRLLVQEVKEYAIFMLDPNGIILTWNAGAQRLKGWSAGEIIGRHFSTFYSQEDIAGRKPERVLETAIAVGRVEDEGWRLRKDGSRFWANVVITALRDSSGKLQGFGKVTRDMTERRRNEEELRHTAERLKQMRDDLEIRVASRTAELSQTIRDLEQANRIKDEFLATLSHELRTPLTAIVGWVQMLRTGALSEDKTSKAMEVIDRNLTLQMKLIDDLLNISRIVSGKLKLEMQLANPAAIVQDALESVRPSIIAKELHLDVSFDEMLGPLRLDPARFQQIVWNLLSNAVKFTPRRGAIRLVMERRNSEAVLKVSDTGEGIEPDFIPFVFDRFRQADSSRSRKHGGLGLGLSIVRHLVELHGGSVSVESPGKGQGSTFAVHLPIPAISQPSRACSESKPAASSLAGIRVLVIEDEADTREMVVQALENNGAIVQEAETARRALDLLEEHPMDVIVSDIGMPDIDGLEFLRVLRQRDAGFQTIPAVALTAYATDDDRAATLKAGFNAHLAKPISLSELIQTVADLHHRG